MLAPTLHFFLLGCCCWWCFLIQNHQMHVVRVSMCNRFFFGYERHSIYLLFASFFCLWSHSLHLVYMNVLCMWRLPFLAFFFSTLYCHHFSEGNENIKRKRLVSICEEKESEKNRWQPIWCSYMHSTFEAQRNILDCIQIREHKNATTQLLSRPLLIAYWCSSCVFYTNMRMHACLFVCPWCARVC